MTKQINEILKLGATRVEMGVQSLDDKSLEFIERGHGVKEVIDSTALLKDSAFKVTYHMMPGLPLSSQKKDIACFKKLFSDKRYIVKKTSLFEREKYSGKEIRKRMIYNKPWKELVPEAVKIIIKDIDGVQRVKGLSH